MFHYTKYLPGNLVVVIAVVELELLDEVLVVVVTAIGFGGGLDVVVVEVSSFQLETTVDFCPLVSVVLNLARDHLDRHQTMQVYQEMKENICQNQTDDHWIILNAGDPKVSSFSNKTRAKPIHFSDSVEPRIGTFLRNDEVWINWHDQSIRVCNICEIGLKGKHNIRNMLAAIAVAQIFEISPGDIRATVINFFPEKLPLMHILCLTKTYFSCDLCIFFLR